MLASLRYYWTRFHRRRALKALAAYHATRDEYRRALVRGDTREQGRLLPLLQAAMTARLKAEAVLTGAGRDYSLIGVRP